MIETHPFGNFLPPQMRYLLLGSFGARGLGIDPQYDWFYGSKRSQLWPIFEQVYKIELPNKSAKQKLFADLRMGIGDIIYQCERRDNNSLDVNLINIVYNPELETILQQNKIEKIFFTSRYVETSYRRVFKDLVKDFPRIELITLPSPSPRYAVMTKEQKVAAYRQLLPKLAV
jgi:hypoxanthine-DNA glycosylase